jgi:hypothetical protein
MGKILKIMKALHLVGIIAILGLAGLSSCEKKPVDPPVNNQPAELTLDWVGLINGNPLPVLGSNTFSQKSAGELIDITNWAFIVSHLALIKENGDTIQLGDGYQWISIRGKKTRFTYKDIPVGNYTGISFMIGLDSAINHGDPNQWPAQHPLNPNLNGMHWGWSGGYIFHALDGIFKDTMAGSSSKGFSFHTATMPLVRSYTLPLSFIVEKGSKTATINIHADRFFSFPNEIALKTKSVSHSEGALEFQLMEKILENMQSGAFELVDVK